MSKGSNTSRKPAIQPDVSAKGRKNYTYREVAVAIGILVVLIAVVVLLIVGFENPDFDNFGEAKAEVENLKVEYKDKVASLIRIEEKHKEREQQLDRREANLKKRETDVAAREEAVKAAEEEIEVIRFYLQSDRADLTAEENEFYAYQENIKTHCDALLAALTQDEGSNETTSEE